MDTLRGTFDSGENRDSDTYRDESDWDPREREEPTGEASQDLPPDAIGQDERRMQVRAYNHWAGLLGERSFPSIEELDPSELSDFGPNSVLLDFSGGSDDPAVQFLGDKLAAECGADGPIRTLADVPARSLLSRITDHYMQILANQAPIGFEAEFVNQRGSAILYRGILLPYSSDDETIDFIYGVINWKEAADQVTSDELLLEIDQALDTSHEDDAEAEPHRHHRDPVTEWADSPSREVDEDAFGGGDVRDLGVGEPAEADRPAGRSLPLPDFGQYELDDPDDEDEDDAGYNFASLSDYIEAPAKKAIDLDADKFDPDDYRVDDEASDPSNGDASIFGIVGPDAAPVGPTEEEAHADVAEGLPADAGLHDCLAAARQLAQNARASEDRSRQALYAAVGRAYDVSLAALDAPREFAELVEESGLTMQDRAPMTPVVKLVFGPDYDKTRLTEYAAVLSHAHRLGLERGALADYLGHAEGGLKGVVKAERRLRREEAGEIAETERRVREELAQKLRELEALTLGALEGEGPEFALVMVRRDETGSLAVLGEIGEDVPMIERAAKKLLG